MIRSRCKNSRQQIRTGSRAISIFREQTYNIIGNWINQPYLVITGENAWSKPASEDVYNAVPGSSKEMHVIPEAGHFDLYDLAPYVPEAFEYITPFFRKNIGSAED